MHARFSASLTIALAMALLTGCNYVEELKLPVLTESGKNVGQAVREARRYPDELPIGEPLDIQVIRVGNAVQLDNRTVHTYPEAQLWLNRQYGAEIGTVGIGSGDPMSLQSFVNLHGEHYPVGGFFTPDEDVPLVLADLIVDGEIRKLTVRLEENWQETNGVSTP